MLTSGPPDIENVTEALRTGPYGRCVYDLDNDVMSQQVCGYVTAASTQSFITPLMNVHVNKHHY